ncbi:MAG: type II toxin-antitoxin system RelE/ParE family toxin [Sulfuritalea sp.]|nr:type II toxin-antitoxin system RelE/ParE family toxin [Sulfuritalea sp.]
MAAAASPTTAERHVNAIIDYCEGLRTFPLRGTRRDDIRPGLRVTNYMGRAVIAFDVDEELVSIIGVFYGGQNFEAALQDGPDESP